MPDNECPEITRINTNLRFEDSIVKAWRYGDLATVVLVPGVNVNVDGSPRAYSVGNKGLANIQMGVKILDDGEYIGYEAHVDKYGHGFGSLWLEAERNNFAVGTRQFDAFALYSGSESSIVGNGRGQPKTQNVAGESIEYYISMTSPNAQQVNFPEDDQRRYFDSGEIPAFVIPRRGDPPHDPLTLLLSERQLAWAYYPDKNHSTFAIGGDIGPKAKFSEATIAFHLLLRYGNIMPIPHYRADSSYIKCPPDVSHSNRSDCLYDPFYQRKDTVTNLKTDVLRVDNLEDTIYVFFNKDVKVADETVTRDIIEAKGQSAMDIIGGIDKLVNCLRQIPELKAHLTKLNETSANIAQATTPTVNISNAAGQNSDTFLQLAKSVNQGVPAKRLVDYKLEHQPDGNPRYWAIVDFGQHSKQKRLYVFDTEANTFAQYYVAHGKGSDTDHNGMAESFSNVPGSNKSSLGIYRCKEHYGSEKHGLSMRLNGLENTNSEARDRAIVFHRADYVSDKFVNDNGKIGRSEGCFVVEHAVCDTLINQLENGSYLIAWKNVD